MLMRTQTPAREWLALMLLLFFVLAFLAAIIGLCARLASDPNPWSPAG
jgi:hypothetical protein